MECSCERCGAVKCIYSMAYVEMKLLCAKCAMVAVNWSKNND